MLSMVPILIFSLTDVQGIDYKFPELAMPIWQTANDIALDHLQQDLFLNELLSLYCLRHKAGVVHIDVNCTQPKDVTAVERSR